MLDIDRIQKLVDMMIAHGLVEISLRDGDVEVNLRRPNTNMAEDVATMTGRSPTSNPTVNPSVPVSSSQSPPAEDEKNVEFMEIRSPMVGTFYTTPDPDSPPFVQVGARVHPDTVVCILEAMKVFNEIKAELTGTIERILVKNEQPVEYGQSLFLVRPDYMENDE